MNHQTISNNTKILSGIIHAIVWAVLLSLPFFFTGRESQSVTVESYLRFTVAPLSFMIVFYINFFLLINKFLFSKRIKAFICANILLIIIVMAGVHFIHELLPPPEGFYPPRERNTEKIIFFIIGKILIYMLVSALSVAIRMTGSWYAADSDRKELERSRAEAELKNLKSQLNPHFLFNTLNNIYSLIAFSPERAQGAVHDLSRLLRYVLYESSQHLVPLTKELDFLHNYVELMRIRLPEEVDVKVDISSVENDNTLIAPLLFISLIENAFKHGVSYSKPSFIYIRLTTGEGDKIKCSILNSYFPKDHQDKSGSGIGLVNLRKRLELLYPRQYALNSERTGDSFVSELELTLKNELP